ncbi:hypothetical protein ACSQ67_026009 [Phaseolus vulgaris]
MASAEIEFRCFVGGLAWATDSEALDKAFSKYGQIIESKGSDSDLTRFLVFSCVQVINDRETGRSRGFGFVTFATEQAMRDAIEETVDMAMVGPAIREEVVLRMVEAGGIRVVLM